MMASPLTAVDVIFQPLDVPVTVEEALSAFSTCEQWVALESSLSGGAYGGFTILAADPVMTVELAAPPRGCPWRYLRDRLDGIKAPMIRSTPVPFAGGWIGFFGYELGAVSEGAGSAKPDAHRMPSARLGLFDTAAVYDHECRQWYTVAVEWAEGTFLHCPSASRRLATLRGRLIRATEDPVVDSPRPLTTTPVPDMSHASYLANIGRIKRYIEAGDVYQVNLTQRFAARTTASPFQLYQRLRKTSPASHGAILVWPGAAVISSSPELFWDLRGRRVVTRPIKGTRPRSSDPLRDRRLRAELAASEKDRAELIMIVDVLRNDLGRVCSMGSIRVPQPSQIEAYSTVYHQVATIEGELKPELGWADLLQATFPGGSITGAPKIRAMQIIDELEPTARGVYCGSIGWIGLGGDASFNIAIRTLVQRRDRVHLYAGGGIVADSDPEEEYEEVLAKLKGMLLALNAGEPRKSHVARRRTVTVS